MARTKANFRFMMTFLIVLSILVLLVGTVMGLLALFIYLQDEGQSIEDRDKDNTVR